MIDRLEKEQSKTESWMYKHSTCSFLSFLNDPTTIYEQIYPYDGKWPLSFIWIRFREPKQQIRITTTTVTWPWLHEPYISQPLPPSPVVFRELSMFTLTRRSSQGNDTCSQIHMMKKSRCDYEHLRACIICPDTELLFLFL